MEIKYPAGATVPAKFDVTENYKEHIEPLIKQLTKACMEHGVPVAVIATLRRDLRDKGDAFAESHAMTLENCYMSMHAQDVRIPLLMLEGIVNEKFDLATPSGAMEAVMAAGSSSGRLSQEICDGTQFGPADGNNMTAQEISSYNGGNALN